MPDSDATAMSNEGKLLLIWLLELQRQIEDDPHCPRTERNAMLGTVKFIRRRVAQGDHRRALQLVV